jgi:hypothetical protein
MPQGSEKPVTVPPGARVTPGIVTRTAGYQWAGDYSGTGTDLDAAATGPGPGPVPSETS